MLGPLTGPRFRALALAVAMAGSLSFATSPITTYAFPVLTNQCELQGNPLAATSTPNPGCGPLSTARTYQIYVGWVPGSVANDFEVAVGSPSIFELICTTTASQPCSVFGTGTVQHNDIVPEFAATPHCPLSTGCAYMVEVTVTTISASTEVGMFVQALSVGDFYFDVVP